MHRARRTFLASQVWLTAFLTLVSGAPRWTCVCPDGRVMPFCLSILPGLSACCCGARADSPSASAGERPCCKGKHGGGSEKGPSHSQFGRRGCHKTLTLSAVVAVPSVSADQQPAGDLHAHVGDFIAASCTSPALRASGPLGAQRYPPGDRIVVLQRLVI